VKGIARLCVFMLVDVCVRVGVAHWCVCDIYVLVLVCYVWLGACVFVCCVVHMIAGPSYVCVTCVYNMWVCMDVRIWYMPAPICVCLP